jgi:tetratricopeptide (TPR) repeat protein
MTKKKSAATAKPASPVPASPVRPVAVNLAAEAARAAQEKQQAGWEEAMKLFAQRRFADARSRFLEVASGPRAEVADKARAYAHMCDRRLGADRPEPTTAEDFFTFGVERLNARDLDQARVHLEKALKLTPSGDHVFYALALCTGFAGDGAAAAENLRRAIELQPGNRIHARQDADFQSLAQQYPALRSLLGSEARVAE